MENKDKGWLAEYKVRADLCRQGFRSAPWDAGDFDLILYRPPNFERVQVKYVEAKGNTIVIRTRSISVTGGKVRRVTQYTAETIDWIAAYEAVGDKCYYVHASELGDGQNLLTLRLIAAMNNQQIGVRMACDYETCVWVP